MATTVLMTVSVSVITLDFSYNEYWSFCDWPVSLSSVFTVHLCYHIGQYLLLFFFKAAYIFFIHPSIHQAGCSCILTRVADAAINMRVQMPFQDPVFSSLGYVHRSGIAGSCSTSISNFLRTLHAVYYSSDTILQSQ